MAWLDDRVWCHPKVIGLTDKSFRVWVAGMAYSSGMGTAGKLDPAAQRLLGGTARIRHELVDAGLWDLNGDGVSVRIHDWEEHNGRRDARKRADRERKRQARARGDK